MDEGVSPKGTTSTPRRRIEALLRRGSYSSHEISREVSVAEREVVSHLEHLHKSLKRSGLGLRVEAAHCLGCGFIFKKRERLGRPGKCPLCKGERIDGPRFSVAEDA